MADMEVDSCTQPTVLWVVPNTSACVLPIVPNMYIVAYTDLDETRGMHPDHIIVVGNISPRLDQLYLQPLARVAGCTISYIPGN